MKRFIRCPHHCCNRRHLCLSKWRTSLGVLLMPRRMTAASASISRCMLTCCATSRDRCRTKANFPRSAVSFCRSSSGHGARLLRRGTPTAVLIRWQEAIAGLPSLHLAHDNRERAEDRVPLCPAEDRAGRSRY